MKRPESRLNSTWTACAIDPDAIRTRADELATSTDTYTRYLVAASIFTPASVIARLVDDPVEYVAAAARANIKAPIEHYCQPAAASQWGCTGDELRQAYNALIAQRARLSPPEFRGVLRRFWRAWGDYMAVRMWLASDPRTDRATLRLLATKGPSERRAVAANPSVANALLSRLATDRDPRVRSAVASNLGTPRNLLSRLARDPDATVREAVADRVSAASPILNWRSCGSNHGALQDEGEPDLWATGLITVSRQNRAVIRDFDANSVPAVLRELADTRSRTEALAIHAVVELELASGHQPTVMHHTNRGFDIESRRNGIRHTIEVKGLGPNAVTVHVSRAQLEMARAHAGTFELAIVTTTETKATSVIRLHDPYPHELSPTLVSAELDVASLRALGTETFLDYSVGGKAGLHTPLFGETGSGDSEPMALGAAAVPEEVR